ncbi:MAG: RecX family transcriptional regulator [Thermaerobacter sp.]|nr:RecX family transcriptional regulator [Thermaerobacter sp.]
MDEAWEALLQLLEHRDLSAAEAQAALQRRGHTKTRAAAAVRQARRLGLLDDARIAQAVRERTTQGAQHGIVRVADDLARRGVDERLIERALAQVDDRARCHTALRAYIARRGRPQERKELRRLLSFLAQKGYAEQSVREVLAAEGIELPDGSA